MVSTTGWPVRLSWARNSEVFRLKSVRGWMSRDRSSMRPSGGRAVYASNSMLPRPGPASKAGSGVLDRDGPRTAPVGGRAGGSDGHVVRGPFLGAPPPLVVDLRRRHVPVPQQFLDLDD